MALTQVLMLEDSTADELVAREVFSHDYLGSFTLTTARTLAEGLRRLEEESFDVILADLNLPDSEGSMTLVRILETGIRAPIVVVSGRDDDGLARECLKLGAQDFLIKNQLPPEWLARSVRYALERARLAMLVAERADEDKQAHDAENMLIGELSADLGTSISAGYYGVRKLSEADAQFFSEASKEYERLLRLAVDMRIYKQDRNPLNEGLRSLAYQLGRRLSGPRDVMELHGACLVEQVHGQLPAHARGLLDESRLVVLQLMGYLVSYYRLHAS